jgi:hypothetical protein
LPRLGQYRLAEPHCGFATMSVEQTDKIDFISTSPGEKVVLTISDHLSWDEDGHLHLLQDKINVYLEFIESEQLLRVPRGK